jgi:mycofactocin precursor
MNEDDEKIKQSENDQKPDKPETDIFSTEEIEIEEMAIDGICGVY